MFDGWLPDMTWVDGNNCKLYIDAKYQAMKALGYQADRSVFDNSISYKDAYDAFITSTFNRSAFSSASKVEDDRCRNGLEHLDNSSSTVIHILDNLQQV